MDKRKQQKTTTAMATTTTTTTTTTTVGLLFRYHRISSNLTGHYLFETFVHLWTCARTSHMVILDVPVPYPKKAAPLR